jgi:hypothetical protein
MTGGGNPSRRGHVQPDSTESLLKELLEETRKIHSRPNPARRVIVWVLVVCVGAVIANITVPGAHRAYVSAACWARYVLAPGVTHPAVSSWHAFGVTSVAPLPASGVAIVPADQGYIWFGAEMPFTRYCDYRIRFDAELIGPTNPALAGYGYGIGLRGTTVNGVPSATTIQFDPPNGGLRITPIPCCANSPGYNAATIPNVVPGAYRHWSIDVIGSNAYVSYSNKGYGQMNLGAGDEILIRVFNASVRLKNITITPIRPSL